MPRQPFNVLVIPFVRPSAASTLYCVLRRSDAGWWQWVSGGGEDNESAFEAARRETFEETGIAGALVPLNSQARVPVNAFKARDSWPADLYVIPEYHFAVEVTGQDIQLSHEHSEYQWLQYYEASSLLHWQSNQTALWELAERLRRNDLKTVETTIA